ncbi:hypothetical protein COV82_02020 [Candidatus Peregrinibacteria bacterium CG11_big_fil_rev_8_21_14_0_20_46_8]|nr:MAG: hypothetical protein COV82_02020 [Candidatus Peregrinibacteria bacterium CG11_big_fil_rev_8_21_14_0_20_46_8]
MQFKIPQDVLRSDKIVGPLTLRQLIMVTAGGGTAYGLYSVLSKQYFVEIWIFPVGFITLLTLAFAFLKYKDIPFERALLLFLEYQLKPRQRTWQKMRGDYIRSVFDTVLHVEKKAANDNDLQKKQKTLHEIVNIVDTQNPLNHQS